MKTALTKTSNKLTTTKSVHLQAVFCDAQWRVCYGELLPPKRRPGRPVKTVEHLFKIVGEILPYASLGAVKKHLKEKEHTFQGVYVAHDSMGCPRYVGRGNIFSRLEASKKAQPLELEYFSFYVVAEKNTNEK
jgi:hypothetical protein